MTPEPKELKTDEKEKLCFILDEVEDEAKEEVVDQGYPYDCC